MSDGDINLTTLANLEEFCIPLPNDFRPTPEELENFYQSFENGNIPELQWRCPGRRPPTPIHAEISKPEETVLQEEPMKNDYDYDDNDFEALPAMRVRNQKGSTSGKKKQANFAGVIDALKKQMLNKDGND